jgi:hypothetical protein
MPALHEHWTRRWEMTSDLDHLRTPAHPDHPAWPVAELTVSGIQLLDRWNKQSPLVVAVAPADGDTFVDRSSRWSLMTSRREERRPTGGRRRADADAVVVGHQPARRRLLRRPCPRRGARGPGDGRVRPAGHRPVGATPTNTRAPVPGLLRARRSRVVSALPDRVSTTPADDRSAPARRRRLVLDAGRQPGRADAVRLLHAGMVLSLTELLLRTAVLPVLRDDAPEPPCRL